MHISDACKIDGGRGCQIEPRPAQLTSWRLPLLQRLAEDVAEDRARIRRPILRHRLLLFGDLQRLDREGRLLRAVEARNLRVELLADLEALGALLVAVAAKVGALDEAGRAVVADLHFQPAVAHFEDGDGDRLALVDAARCRRPPPPTATPAALELLHAEADALLLDIDVEHDGLDRLALVMKRQRFLAGRAPGDVRHVDHPVDVAVEADEQAELGRILDLALDLACRPDASRRRRPTDWPGPA